MFADSTYWIVTLGLVVVAVGATLWVVMALPSRRRSRAEKAESRAKANAELLRHRAELRMLPIRWEEQQRKEAHAEWRRKVEAVVDPMVNRWLDANPGRGDIPQPVLDELLTYAEEQVGPEPPR